MTPVFPDSFEIWFNALFGLDEAGAAVSTAPRAMQ